MSGYIDLDRTGIPEIDLILNKIEEAGSAYHHTEYWCDTNWDGSKSYVEQINELIYAARLNLTGRIIE